jgi:GMP synthase (glutamine-hydrolysing)
MGEWLAEAGLGLDVRRPYAGDVLPDHLREHCGMLVLGGDMGAYDDKDFPWLTDVKRLAVAAVRGANPVLGICLGHQLVAVALGGEVARNPLGQQVGVLDVGWTGAARADPLAGALPARDASTPAAHWNNDVVTRLPDGAVDLAHTPRGELQAARFAATMWGVQWHPEAGEEIIGPWAEHDRDDAAERGVDLDAYVADVAAARTALREAGRHLADGFAAVCRKPAPAGTGA